MDMEIRISYLQNKIDDLRDDRIDAETDEDYDYADYLSDKIERLVEELDILIEQRDMNA